MMAEFPSVTHVAVTVNDLSVSAPWYGRLFGTPPVLDEDTGPFRHVAFALGDVLFALHEFPGGSSDDRFDERRIGLDHVSFGCADRAALADWQARLEELGIDHGGILDAHYGSALAFRDPDNIALELFAPPS
jgi:glyoxylase I family protein